MAYRGPRGSLLSVASRTSALAKPGTLALLNHQFDNLSRCSRSARGPASAGLCRCPARSLLTSPHRLERWRSAMILRRTDEMPAVSGSRAEREGLLVIGRDPGVTAVIAVCLRSRFKTA